MIRKLQQIKSFGVFSDFKWPAGLPDFKQFNLLYGWNYSGKTTLSRIFRCFEQRQAHPDFASAQVQLAMADGKTHHLSSPGTAPEFRVFNSDFIRDNLKFDVASATPILVLGAEDIVKQERLTKLKKERDTLIDDRTRAQQSLRAKDTAIEKALTNAARDLIKNALSVPNYDKTRFAPKVSQCKNNPSKYVLNENEVANLRAVYLSTDKKPALKLKTNSFSAVGDLRRTAKKLLARTVTAAKPIARLKQNEDLEQWVEAGRHLHEKKNACQFCGQQLPAGLLADLAQHFSQEYEELMGELNTAALEFLAAQNEEITFDDKADFYPAFQEQFAEVRGKFGKIVKTRKAAIETLRKAIDGKRTKAFTNVECPAIDDPEAEIESALKAINEVIANHNARTEEFETKRAGALASLELHHAAAFVQENKYNEALAEIADAKNLIVTQNEQLTKLNGAILQLEKELSEATRGAERINELLAAYFGKDDVRITNSQNGSFQISRGDVVAKNLSEGEKTAIAFAYFITRVQDGRHPVADTRVIIDDPISSLDSNHLFNTYSIIKIELSGCKQLYISTHSFEFFSLIKEWVIAEEDTKKPQSQWKKCAIFIVKRLDDGTAVLDEIPKELLKFRSEYHYLFSTLYHFDKSGGTDYAELLSLPNVVRRFMEAFGGIMIPLSTGLHGKMERLFPDQIVRERVWKFINHYSHNTTIVRSLTIPDMSESKSIVKACLKAVSDWDSTYFSELEAEVK